jgi:hypothetical protein
MAERSVIADIRDAYSRELDAGKAEQAEQADKTEA